MDQGVLGISQFGCVPANFLVREKIPARAGQECRERELMSLKLRENAPPVNKEFFTAGRAPAGAAKPLFLNLTLNRKLNLSPA
jgi:hypothetical protein